MKDETRDICREIQHTAKREARKHPDFYGQVTVHFLKGAAPKVVAQRHFLDEELDDEPGEGLVKKTA